jgi:hypothetical protein
MENLDDLLELCYQDINVLLRKENERYVVGTEDDGGVQRLADLFVRADYDPDCAFAMIDKITVDMIEEAHSLVVDEERISILVEGTCDQKHVSSLTI